MPEPPFYAMAAMPWMRPCCRDNVFLRRTGTDTGGSNRLRGAILQVLSRCLLQGESIESAVHAPRLHNEADWLDFEPECLSEQEKEQLMQLGWRLKPWRQQSVYFGGVHAICCAANGQWTGCGDPRRGGALA